MAFRPFTANSRSKLSAAGAAEDPYTHMTTIRLEIKFFIEPKRGGAVKGGCKISNLYQLRLLIDASKVFTFSLGLSWS